MLGFSLVFLTKWIINILLFAPFTENCEWKVILLSSEIRTNDKKTISQIRNTHYNSI